MSFGLEVYDESGNPTLTLTDRVGRILGSVVSGTSAGSITVPALATGTPFYILRSEWLGVTLCPPTVTISGTQISWTFADPTFTERVSAEIFYGVY